MVIINSILAREIRSCKCLRYIDFLENGDTQYLEDFVQTGVEAQTLLDNRYKNIHGDSYPELRLHPTSFLLTMIGKEKIWESTSEDIHQLPTAPDDRDILFKRKRK